jgi:hypothetical protein
VPLRRHRLKLGVTRARAAELKAEPANADLPGYKGGFGFGGHHR